MPIGICNGTLNSTAMMTNATFFLSFLFFFFNNWIICNFFSPLRFNFCLKYKEPLMTLGASKWPFLVYSPFLPWLPGRWWSDWGLQIPDLNTQTDWGLSDFAEHNLPQTNESNLRTLGSGVVLDLDSPMQTLKWLLRHFIEEYQHCTFKIKCYWFRFI